MMVDLLYHQLRALSFDDVCRLSEVWPVPERDYAHPFDRWYPEDLARRRREWVNGYFAIMVMISAGLCIEDGSCWDLSLNDGELTAWCRRAAALCQVSLPEWLIDAMYVRALGLSTGPWSLDK